MHIVCLSDDNFGKPARRKFIFAHPGNREHGSSSSKVIGSRSRSQEQEPRRSQMPVHALFSSVIFISTHQMAAPQTTPRGWSRLGLERSIVLPLQQNTLENSHNVTISVMVYVRDVYSP